MTKTETIRARVEPQLKHEAEQVFAALGMSATQAITLFYKQVSLHHGIPFEVKIPNTQTLAAIREAEQKDSLTRFGSVKDLMADSVDA